jgi:hypothetical protein
MCAPGPGVRDPVLQGYHRRNAKGDGLAFDVWCARVVGAVARMLTVCCSCVSIIDEAGQATEPSVLGSLLTARCVACPRLRTSARSTRASPIRAQRVCSRGRHAAASAVGKAPRRGARIGRTERTWAPAQVQSREARQRGLGKSLFQRLSETHPAAVAPLNTQYRMSADIMTISNKVALCRAAPTALTAAAPQLVYRDQLCCGSDSVALQSLADIDGYVDKWNRSAMAAFAGFEVRSLFSRARPCVPMRAGRHVGCPVGPAAVD